MPTHIETLATEFNPPKRPTRDQDGIIIDMAAYCAVRISAEDWSDRQTSAINQLKALIVLIERGFQTPLNSPENLIEKLHELSATVGKSTRRVERNFILENQERINAAMRHSIPITLDIPTASSIPITLDIPTVSSIPNTLKHFISEVAKCKTPTAQKAYFTENLHKLITMEEPIQSLNSFFGNVAQIFSHATNNELKALHESLTNLASTQIMHPFMRYEDDDRGMEVVLPASHESKVSALLLSKLMSLVKRFGPIAHIESDSSIESPSASSTSDSTTTSAASSASAVVDQGFFARTESGMVRSQTLQRLLGCS